MAGYNSVAWFYDGLSRMVYGKALIRSQVYLLQFIPPHSSVLIVGGGTGWILDEITRIYPSGLQITYVEIAEKMLELSRKRNTGNNQVRYINDAIENVSGLAGFDVIITSFLFDNFTPSTLKKIFTHLHSMLKSNGVWLNTDFQLTGKWWQNVLLKSMLLFFKVLCGIESTKLPDIGAGFEQQGYNIIADKTFFGEFITAKAYTKKT